jgi:hypothetical protein
MRNGLKVVEVTKIGDLYWSKFSVDNATLYFIVSINTNDRIEISKP